MNKFVKIITISALCAIASVSLASNITVKNDTTCHVTDSGTISTGAATDIYSYTVNNPSNPTSAIKYRQITAAGGQAPVFTIEGYTGILIGDNVGRNLTFDQGAINNDYIVTYTLQGDALFAAFDQDPCGTNSAKLLGVFKAHPMKKLNIK